mgnify:CR=1 FL=1
MLSDELTRPARTIAALLRERGETVAVANLHGINFTLGLGRFTEQIRAVADELRRHSGPVVFGGDFNTWSAARQAEVEEVMRGLGLVPVLPTDDTRRRFFSRSARAERPPSTKMTAPAAALITVRGIHST